MAFNIMDAIKNRPEQATSAETKSDGRIKIEYISIKNIVPAANSRNYYSTADIETLKADIALRGVKQNLIVKAVEDGKYELIAGERRWRASSALFDEGRDDCEFIPCAVEQPTDDLDERLLLTTTNSTARELTDYEKGLQVKEMDEILDEYERRGAIIEGPRRELIQKHLGLSSGQIGRYTAIHNNLSEDLLREYVKKEISVSVAYELSRLSEDEQAEAYQLYIDQGGLSIKDVKALRKAEEPPEAETQEQDLPETVGARMGGANEYEQPEFTDTATEKEKPQKPWAEMTPCEQCRAANPWCKELHCCKTCEEPCNTRQICRIDDPPEKRQAEIDEWNRQTQEQWQAAKESEELARQKQQQVPRFTALEREQAKIDEWNRHAQEQRQASIENEEPAEQEAEPACLIIEGDARPKSGKEAQPEKRVGEVVEPGLLKIEAAKFTMGVLEREIEKCGIEIRYAEEQGKTAKGALAAAKLEYLGGVLSKVQADLFDMIGDDMFKE